MTIEKKKILVLEDEELIALDLQNRLYKKGFDVYIASNGKEAKDVFLSNHIDLGLIDISLQDEKTGIDVVRELYQIRNFPVIYTTAYDDEEIISQINKTSPYGYLLKPCDEKELIFTVKISLEKAEKDLALKKQHYWIKSILNSITDLIIVADENSKISFANSVAQNYFDFNIDNQQLSDEIIFYDNENHEFEKNFIFSIIQSKVPVIFPTVTIKSKRNGKQINASCSMVPLQEDEDVCKGVVLTVKKVK